MLPARKKAVGPLMANCKLLTSIMLVAGALVATPAAAVTQSWNGYKWARTGSLVIGLGDNLTSAWSPRLAPTAAQWSAADNIDFVVTAGRSTSACGAVFGGVQVCNANYGANGWLGYTNVWLSGGFIVQAVVKLNDHYFGMKKYNTEAWRQMTICHELGHTLGLGHTNTSRTNANTGSCLDYTNDPSGLAGGANGTLANIAPNATDFAALDAIYATPNATQLASTKLEFWAGDGLSIDDRELEFFASVPEPASWGLLLAGFGGIGAMLRRRRGALAA